MSVAKPIGPEALVKRLCRAVNEHDLEALTDCFALDYRNETPAHPARGFQGRSQVRRNWEQIFAAVPDITAEVSLIADQETVWSEWEMRGTRQDGTPHLMRGVVIFGVDQGDVTWARFYLEPVEEGGADIDETIRRAMVARSNPDPASEPVNEGGEGIDAATRQAVTGVSGTSEGKDGSA